MHSLIMPALGASLFAFVAAAPVLAQDAKPISLVVGFSAGGGYDAYARVLSRHFGKHMVGSPRVIVQNMPGAGSMVMANYMYNVAPKDGTSFGIFARNIPLISVLGGNNAVNYDARKYTWLGSMSSYEEDAYLMWVRKDAKVKTLADIQKKGGDPVVLGGTGEGATGNDVPIILRETLGLNIKQIVGYPDSNALFLAIERGEVDGRTTDLSSVKTNRPDWLKPNSYMHTLMQFGRATRHPEFPNVPTARELALDDKARALIELTELPYVLSRPFVAPPNVPADRAAALQKAFLDTCKDADLTAEAQKLGIGITPIDGKAVLALIDKIAATPQADLDRVRAMLDDGKGGK
jgi:tripartite-type tricarboxylate transporter receptor subunit TctC